jgi:hypothetical protein
MMSSIVGIALILTRVGVIAYTIPALSRSFLNGNPEGIRILDYIFAGPVGAIEDVSVLFYSAGFILFGVAIWRSGVLPKWAGSAGGGSCTADLRAVFGGGFGGGGAAGARGRWVDRPKRLAESSCPDGS